LTVTKEGFGAIEFLDAQGKIVDTLAPKRFRIYIEQNFDGWAIHTATLRNPASVRINTTSLWCRSSQATHPPKQHLKVRQQAVQRLINEVSRAPNHGSIQV
jgi:hypothetical protein